MVLTFTKEIIEKYKLANYGIVKNCGIYKVYNNAILLGQFFTCEFVSYFAFENHDIRIDTTQHFFKDFEYKIIDQIKAEPIGLYIISSWKSQRHNVGKLLFGTHEYNCNRLKPDIDYKLLKKETWGHYKIHLNSGECTIIYTFKIDFPWIGGSDTAFMPFSGEIISTDQNLFPVFAGLFFLEIIFDGEKN